MIIPARANQMGEFDRLSPSDAVSDLILFELGGNP